MVSHVVHDFKPQMGTQHLWQSDISLVSWLSFCPLWLFYISTSSQSQYVENWTWETQMWSYPMLPHLGKQHHPASCSTQTRCHHPEFPHSLPLIQPIIIKSHQLCPPNISWFYPLPLLWAKSPLSLTWRAVHWLLPLLPPVLHRQSWRSGYSWNRSASISLPSLNP